MSRSVTDPLSKTEIEVLVLYAEGRTTEEICRLKRWKHKSSPVARLRFVKAKLALRMGESHERTLAKAYIAWLDKPIPAAQEELDRAALDREIDATKVFFHRAEAV